MANWTPIQTITYKDSAGTLASNSGNIKVIVEYDKDRTNPAHTYIRFNASDNSDNYTDGFYVIYNPNLYPDTIPRKLFLLKAKNGSWRTTGDYEVKKSYTDNDYTIQDFWICNTGQGAVDWGDGTADGDKGGKVTYDDGTKTFYNMFKSGGKRQNYKKTVSSYQLTQTIVGKDISATDPEPGKVTVTDNGNNTFTLSVTANTAGQVNPIKKTVLEWDYYDTNTDNFKAFTNGAVEQLTIADSSKAYRPVWASCEIFPTYGADSIVESTTTNVKQYVAPSKPGKASITTADGKFNLLQPWTVSWKASTRANSSSDILGYRIRLQKKKKGSSTWEGIDFISKTTGASLCAGTTGGKYGTNDYYYDRPVDKGTTMTIHPELQDLKSGDSFRIKMHAYTKDGKGNGLFSGGNTSAGVESTNYIIDSSGNVQIWYNNQWVTGEVFVRLNDTWVAAEGVKIYHNGNWVDAI